MDVKKNEFKVNTSDNDIFGIFRVSRDISVEEIGERFMSCLRAELAVEAAKRAKLKEADHSSDG